MEGIQEIGTNVGSKMDIINGIEALWKRFRSLVVVGKKALKRRVCEIS